MTIVSTLERINKLEDEASALRKRVGLELRKSRASIRLGDKGEILVDIKENDGESGVTLSVRDSIDFAEWALNRFAPNDADLAAQKSRSETNEPPTYYYETRDYEAMDGASMNAKGAIKRATEAQEALRSIQGWGEDKKLRDADDELRYAVISLEKTIKYLNKSR
jgi:hypothetical protein